jgi:hypothetical protein
LTCWFGIVPTRGDLQRNSLSILLVVPRSFEDDAHAAASDLTDDAVAADAFGN